MSIYIPVMDEKRKTETKTVDNVVRLAPTGIASIGNGENSEEAIRVLGDAIQCGEHWYLALLRAMGMWDVAQEIYNGYFCCYLVAGEAFDWLLLAERLCAAVDKQIPEEEKMNLIFAGRPPLRLTEREYKRLIGIEKYRQYLNYFYGITLEEALFLVMQDEVRKEQRSFGCYKDGDVVNEVYRRLYGATRGILLKQFRQQKRYPHTRYIGLGELKEFTYWRFKQRLNRCDRVRIASDTRKGLNKLSRDGFPGQLLYCFEDTTTL